MENQKPQRFKNLTEGERKALQGFSERDDNVTLKADKGGVVVIIDDIREAVPVEKQG